MRTVLIVDDDADVRAMVRLILEAASVDFDVVAEAANGSDALTRWEAMQPPPVPHVIVLDNFMPDRTGLEVAKDMLAAMPDQPIVLFSAFLDSKVCAEAESVGIAACVDKSSITRLPQVLADLTPDPVG